MDIQTISTIWDLFIAIIGPFIGALVGVYLGFKIDGQSTLNKFICLRCMI